MNRYSRNILTIGKEGQQRLSEGSAFVIGCGALGGQVAMLLAGAGVRQIGLADFDTIDLTNLQRQLFFKEEEAGKYKIDALSARMFALNSEVKIAKYPVMITRHNASDILKEYDFIIDATDNPASKYTINEICRELGKPHCIGGVAGWRGQVMSFDGSSGADGFSALFPRPQAEEEGILPCELEGVIGAAASLIASVQAGEAIKFLSGEGEMLYDKVLVMDLRSCMFQTFHI